MKAIINHSALIAIILVIVVMLMIIPVVAQTNESLNATPGQAASPPSSAPVIVLNWYSTGIVLALIALLGMMFYLLVVYSHRLDSTGYLSKLYHESLEDLEYQRRASRLRMKKDSGEYTREVKEDSSWREKNPIPRLTPELEQRYGSTFYEEYAPVLIPVPDEKDPMADQVNAYKKNVNEWDNNVRLEADRRFTAEMNMAKKEAAKMAELGLDIDAGMLKGRGPEFVLEFTTVVVIIFAAVILGVIGVLSTEQIGTLLAAIAGYVLGRATTRAKEGAPAIPAATSDAVDIIKAVKGTPQETDKTTTSTQRQVP